MRPSRNVLFIVPYPLRFAPSQRFRVELYLPLCEKHGVAYDVASFWDEATYRILYKKGTAVKKLLGLLGGFARRFLLLFRLHRYEYVFIHREASPVGPPVFEWLIAKLFRKKIIYDFDDAIWLADSDNRFLNWLKAFWKIRRLCKWAYKVAGGNAYLCSYAARVNPAVVLLPTCVDTEEKHNRLKQQDTGNVVIGWTGTHSTLKYLDLILPVLQKVAETETVDILIICNRPPAFSLPNLKFRPWNEDREIEDLLELNIGIMPLQEDTWSEGKCGFKIIQYLALGIPAVASPVGINRSIIEEGKNGFLCATADQWEKALRYLVTNQSARQAMGQNGREKVVAQYSIQANEAVFFSLFT